MLLCSMARPFFADLMIFMYDAAALVEWKYSVNFCYFTLFNYEELLLWN